MKEELAAVEKYMDLLIEFEHKKRAGKQRRTAPTL